MKFSSGSSRSTARRDLRRSRFVGWYETFSLASPFRQTVVEGAKEESRNFNFASRIDTVLIICSISSMRLVERVGVADGTVLRLVGRSPSGLTLTLIRSETTSPGLRDLTLLSPSILRMVLQDLDLNLRVRSLICAKDVFNLASQTERCRHSRNPC